MGWFKKEARAFGKEFARQGSILVFGKAPSTKPNRQRKKTGAHYQYERAQRWAKRHGFK